MKKTLSLKLVLFCLFSCQSIPNKKVIEIGTLAKIDVHSHYQYSRSYLPTFFKKWNMRSVLVDVAKEESLGVSRSWGNYLNHATSQHELYFLCTSLIGTGIDIPDFVKKAIQQLEDEISSGAKMVKVWKNFGMVTKDASGNFIQIDDRRLQPIWDYLKSKGIPVMAHIAEPEQAWRALDPKNPHYGYYKKNPQYHAYTIPEIPSYETIITARDRWIENNSDLQILCAHLGSMSHDVDMVATRLDQYPNMSIEIGARFGDLASQDSKIVSAFFEKYQDRIMFGSDYGNSKVEASMTAAELKEEENDLDINYTSLWRYLSSDDSLEIRGQNTKGLKLNQSILEKVYALNAINLLKLK
tara:strand:- start:37 stop:1101 length:1065 start_codon:yes stop_codon:yes gene_type:complete